MYKRQLKRFFIAYKSEKTIIKEYIDRLRVKTTNSEYLISSLSGGNQQKVIIARLLMISPNIIVLNDPTRGVDAVSYTHLISHTVSDLVL